MVEVEVWVKMYLVGVEVVAEWMVDVFAENHVLSAE